MATNHPPQPAPATPAVCPECGRTLPTDSTLSGICPACAWRTVLGPATEETGVSGERAPLFSVAGHDVIAEIARGGAGVVYRARQLTPSREVALKMLLPQQLGSDEMITRFRVEADTVAALDHPTILPVYAVALHCGVPFFTMKLASGGTLTDRRSTFRGQWREIAELVSTLADAVQFAHSRGVIHRDLKPGNILFDESGRPYISDFGLAKYVGEGAAITRTHHLLGTPAYLAPEVAQRGAQAATIASDVYGLGGVLYELLAQAPPFAADSLSALLKNVAETAPEFPRLRVPGVPRDLEIICLRALAKGPAERFASAGELAADLRRWREGRPIVSRPASAAERAWRWCRRRPALAALWLALLTTVAGSAVVQWRANRSLSRALAATRSAEIKAQEKLHAALLSEARLQGRSRQPGQQTRTLEILAQAARLAPTVDVRSETASALSRPDITLVRELPGVFPDNLTLIDFSPDLASYLMPLREGGIVRQSTVDGRPLQRYSTPAAAKPRHLRFSRDGRVLSAIFADRRTGFWLGDGDQPVWIAPPEAGIVTPVSLHPFRPLVAYRVGDAEIRVRDLVAGTEQSLSKGGRRIWTLAFDPQGSRLAVVRENAIEIHDVTTGTIICSRPETPLGMTPAWSDDGTLFATGSYGRNDISLRDSQDGSVRQTLSGHTTYPGQVRFLPDGDRVVSIAYDRTLRLWDVATGRELLQAPLMTRGFNLSSDGRRLGAASENDRPALFEWAENSVLREISGHLPLSTSSTMDGFDISARGDWIATGNWESSPRFDNRLAGRVGATIWDTQRANRATSFTFETSVNDRATVLVDARESAVVYSVSTGGVWRRQLQVGPERQFSLDEERSVGPPGTRFLLRIDPAGDWIVRRLPEKSLALWPQGDPSRESELIPSGATGQEIVYVDPHRLVTRASPEGELRLWSLDTGAETGRIATTRPTRVAFSPGGDALVVGTDESYQAWAYPGLQPGPSWPVRKDGSPLKEFSFSPSGRWFAGELGGSTIEIRDGRSFALLVRLEPTLNLEMNGIRWAPDESRIYLKFRGSRIFFWDLAALKKELAKRGLDW